jgi:hypothetical protein
LGRAPSGQPRGLARALASAATARRAGRLAGALGRELLLSPQRGQPSLAGEHGRVRSRVRPRLPLLPGARDVGRGVVRLASARPDGPRCRPGDPPVTGPGGAPPPGPRPP